MITTSLNVTDMHCASCSAKITEALMRQSAIKKVNVNPLRRLVFVTHQNELSAHEITESISQIGFSPRLMDTLGESNGAPQTTDRKLLKRLGVAAFCMMQVMMVQVAIYAGAAQDMQPDIALLLRYSALMFTIPVMTFSAVPFLRSGFFRLQHGVNMDTPIAAAVSIAFGVSLVNVMRNAGDVYFDSVTMFVFLMLAARYLNERIRNKLQLEDQLLANLPRMATKVSADQKHISVSLKSLACGDRIWVAQGEIVPLDGYLESDYASVDLSLLTGESEPSQLNRNMQLFAGTLNRGSGFKLRVSATPEDSRIAKINEIAQHAELEKAQHRGFADRIARVFIPAILSLAGLTFIYWMQQDLNAAISATIAVLVVSCPCALSLAIPAAHAAALTRLRRLGLLVRNSQALERLTEIRTVFFDKTGTLTTPEPKLIDIELHGVWNAELCLNLATALQRHSKHPLAKSFTTFSGTGDNIDRVDVVDVNVVDVNVVGGQGVAGRWGDIDVRIGSAAFCQFEQPQETPELKQVYLSIADQPAATFQVATPLRDDARATVDWCKNEGLDVQLISGDALGNCKMIADTLGIEYHNGASPESKRATLLANQTSLFVGDGLNDLPALATASVSVATFETVDLVKSKADVLMMTAKLSCLVDLFTVARRTRRVVRQNLGWAVLYNLIAIPLAAAGVVAPWMAAVGMSASSLIVMLNATRLLNSPGAH